MMPAGGTGLLWNATIIPDEFIVNGQVVKGSNKRDFDMKTKTIKPRRPSLPVTQKEFFSSVTEIYIEGEARPRYIFYGVLNG
jgi:hypothetical protein